MLNIPAATVKPERSDLKVMVRAPVNGLPTTYEKLGKEYPILGAPTADLSAVTTAMPWMKGAIDQVLRDQALRKRFKQPGFSFRPVVLAGARFDVRHTLFISLLAEAADVPWCTLHAAQVGRPNDPILALRAIQETECANPIVLVPDILQCGFGQITQLSRMLDRRDAKETPDPFLNGDFDVSMVSWLLVVERATDLPGVFLDLCHVVDVRESAQDTETFKKLLANATIDQAAEEMGVPPSSLPRKQLLDFIAEMPATSLMDMRKRAIDALADSADWNAPDFGETTKKVATVSYAQVCQEISGVGTNGEEFVRVYEKLTRPLPLAGAAVTPEIFRKTLTDEFPWLHQGINMIARDMELVHIGSMPRFQFRPLILHGPAGIGKSRFARRMADLARTGYRYVSAGGLAGGAEFAGTGRSAEDPHPSTPVLAMYRSGTANPIVFVDEIDKIEHGRAGGTLEDALLAVLESETAKRYFDECLQAQVDLSFVSYIFAVNDVHQVNPILLDRMRIVSVKRPPPEAFPTILENILYEVARDFAVSRHLLPKVEDFPEAGLEFRSGKSIRNIKNIIFNKIPQLVTKRRAEEYIEATAKEDAT